MKDLVFQELIGDESFDASTLCSQVPFTQAPFYGDWQKTLGRRIKRFIVKDKDEVIQKLQDSDSIMLIKKGIKKDTLQINDINIVEE